MSCEKDEIKRKRGRYWEFFLKKFNNNYSWSVAVHSDGSPMFLPLQKQQSFVDTQGKILPKWVTLVLAYLKQLRKIHCSARCCEQYDQIGRFIALWATIQSLRQQLLCPNWKHFRQFLKRFHFLWYHFWATFKDIWRLFYWSHWL